MKKHDNFDNLLKITMEFNDKTQILLGKEAEGLAVSLR